MRNQNMIPDNNKENSVAILSSFDRYTTFSHGGITLTFRTCDGLEKYTKVMLWNDGYLEVMAKYKTREEYWRARGRGQLANEVARRTAADMLDVLRDWKKENLNY